jgi:uncharacterized protein with ATP-grasp and redox domains
MKITKRLEINLACVTCAIGSVVQLAQKGVIPLEKQEPTMRALLRFLADVDFRQTPPELGRGMHRVIRQEMENPDPYAEIKKFYNSEMLKHYPDFKKLVAESPQPFETALRLAIAGNIIDLGPNHEFEVMPTIQRVLSSEFAINDSEQLWQDLSKAKSVLYLADNAGEIVLDRLFLETIQHPNVWFAVRGKPIINDVTLEDAHAVGIDRLAQVISNGDDAPGTLLASTSPEFQKIFNAVDLIISKGQGNLEGLVGTTRPVYFLLMIKCELVGQLIGVKKGDFVVLKNE